MTNYLSASKSRCEERAPIIVSEEERKKHTANNVDKCVVRHYKIDGDVIPGSHTAKCDFLVLNDESKQAYFIELKGSDVIHAIDQVEETVSLLKSELCGYILHGRVVCKRVPKHDNSKVTERKLKYQKNNHGGTLGTSGQGQYTEDI